MKITYKGDYALKTILDLALHYGEGLVTINELARRADMPIKFLEQILSDLRRGGFVESRRGKVGGYFLARPPGQIRLGEVVRFIDGPVEPIACVAESYSGCRDITSCVFKKIWQDVSDATSNIIDGVTFEELTRKVRCKKEKMAYQI